LKVARHIFLQEVKSTWSQRAVNLHRPTAATEVAAAAPALDVAAQVKIESNVLKRSITGSFKSIDRSWRCLHSTPLHPVNLHRHV
jgi:hypothetical protein